MDRVNKPTSSRAQSFKKKSTTIDKRMLRAHRRSQEWKQLRTEQVNAHRNLDQMSPLKEESSAKKSGDDRRAALQKWKTERELKRKLESQAKKPTFKVSVVNKETKIKPLPKVDTTLAHNSSRRTTRASTSLVKSSTGNTSTTTKPKPPAKAAPAPTSGRTTRSKVASSTSNSAPAKTVEASKSTSGRSTRSSAAASKPQTTTVSAQSRASTRKQPTKASAAVSKTTTAVSKAPQPRASRPATRTRSTRSSATSSKAAQEESTDEDAQPPAKTRAVDDEPVTQTPGRTPRRATRSQSGARPAPSQSEKVTFKEPSSSSDENSLLAKDACSSDEAGSVKPATSTPFVRGRPPTSLSDATSGEEDTTFSAVSNKFISAKRGDFSFAPQDFVFKPPANISMLKLKPLSPSSTADFLYSGQDHVFTPPTQRPPRAATSSSKRTPSRKNIRNSLILAHKSPEEGIEILKQSPMIELRRRTPKHLSPSPIDPMPSLDDIPDDLIPPPQTLDFGPEPAEKVTEKETETKEALPAISSSPKRLDSIEEEEMDTDSSCNHDNKIVPREAELVAEQDLESVDPVVTSSVPEHTVDSDVVVDASVIPTSPVKNVSPVAPEEPSAYPSPSEVDILDAAQQSTVTEETIAVPEETIAVPEETSAVTEETSAVTEETSTVTDPETVPDLEGDQSTLTDVTLDLLGYSAPVESNASAEDVDLATETKADSDIALDTKQDSDIAMETKQDTDIAMETKQDTDDAVEINSECDIAMETTDSVATSESPVTSDSSSQSSSSETQALSKPTLETAAMETETPETVAVEAPTTETVTMELPVSETVAMETPASESQPPVHDVKYFRDLMVSETRRLLVLCQQWEEVNTATTPGLTDEVEGQIRTTIGQAQLLMAQRFKQFSGLVDNCEFGTGEKETHCSDLEGFWEMIYFQVEDVDDKFVKLGKLRSNNWVSDAPKPKKIVRKKPVASKPKGGKPAATGRSNFASFRAKLAQQKQQSEVKVAEVAKEAITEPEAVPAISVPEQREASAEREETKTFNAGFFQVQSPVGSPKYHCEAGSPGKPISKRESSSPYFAVAVGNAVKDSLSASPQLRTVCGDLDLSYQPSPAQDVKPSPLRRQPRRSLRTPSGRLKAAAAALTTGALSPLVTAEMKERTAEAELTVNEPMSTLPSHLQPSLFTPEETSATVTPLRSSRRSTRQSLRILNFGGVPATSSEDGVGALDGEQATMDTDSTENFSKYLLPQASTSDSVILPSEKENLFSSPASRRRSKSTSQSFGSPLVHSARTRNNSTPTKANKERRMTDILFTPFQKMATPVKPPKEDEEQASPTINLMVFSPLGQH